MTWRIANLQLTSAASVLRSSGMPALNAMVAKWPETERRFLSVTPAFKPSADESVSDRPAKMMVEWVTGADNQSYLLSYDLEGLRAEYRPPKRWRLLNIPEPMVWVGGLGACCSAPCWPGT